MAIETVPFDASEFFDTEESQADLIADAFETGSPQYITHALGIVAKAEGMSTIASRAGVTREALYKALSDNGDPKFSTLMGVLKALNLKITVEHIQPVEDESKTEAKGKSSTKTFAKRTRSRSRRSGGKLRSLKAA